VAEEGNPEELKKDRHSHFANLAKGKKKGDKQEEDSDFSISDLSLAFEEGTHNLS